MRKSFKAYLACWLHDSDTHRPWRTDARLWRYRNVPAYVYGPPPTGMGTYNEYVEIETFLHVVRCHVLIACNYLSHSVS